METSTKGLGDGIERKPLPEVGSNQVQILCYYTWVDLSGICTTFYFSSLQFTQISVLLLLLTFSKQACYFSAFESSVHIPHSLNIWRRSDRKDGKRQKKMKKQTDRTGMGRKGGLVSRARLIAQCQYMGGAWSTRGSSRALLMWPFSC